MAQVWEDQKQTIRNTDSQWFAHSAIPSTCPYTIIHWRQRVFLTLYLSTNLHSVTSQKITSMISIFTSMKTSNLTLLTVYVIGLQWWKTAIQIKSTYNIQGPYFYLTTIICHVLLLLCHACGWSAELQYGFIYVLSVQNRLIPWI